MPEQEENLFQQYEIKKQEELKELEQANFELGLFLYQAALNCKYWTANILFLATQQVQLTVPLHCVVKQLRQRKIG